MVRLKAPPDFNIIDFDACFNSKVVRLKVQSLLNTPLFLQSFNSKVVRLKVKRGLGVERVEVKFQFQSGAVKSNKPS